MKDAKHKFWQAFVAQANSLARSVTGRDFANAFQRIESLLQKYGFDFCFELTEEGGDAVLVLTPEGDRAEASRIDDLLKARPEITGWRFYGRRQRKPLEDAFVFVRHVYDLDVSDATFDLRATERGQEVTMYSDAIEGLAQEAAEGLIATFLDHAVGEDIVMKKVARLIPGSGRGQLSPPELVEGLLS